MLTDMNSVKTYHTCAVIYTASICCIDSHVLPSAYITTCNAISECMIWSLADLQATGDTRGARRGSALGHVASPASTAAIDRHSTGKRLWKGRREIAILLPIPIWGLWVSACSSCCCCWMHGHGASTPTPVRPHVHAITHEHAWRWVANVWSAWGAL